MSNLPAETFSEPVTQATPFTYVGENRVIGHHVARLNLTCAGSMRAPGEAVGVPVMEMAMDELAHAAGIDPLELRLRNIPDKDPSSGKPFSSNRLADCLRRGAESFGWSDRGRARDPTGRRMAGRHGHGVRGPRQSPGSQHCARDLLPDGTARVETDMTDIGTGSYAILTQIAAEVLGLPTDRVTTVLGDSDLPASSGSGGSVGAASSGSSVMLAAKAVRAQLAERMDCRPDDLTLKDGTAICANVRRGISDLLAGDTLQAMGEIKPGRNSQDHRQASWRPISPKSRSAASPAKSTSVG